ncbi:FAD:protein FMN transferase [Flexibacterium corallicola]|uniref:FAD:protein FMN transferase n=1 Tax=Flexibacterium corallicola TaxID=3037259 RepID=UPI00286F40E5|nr:FAD:protein FMN transferase [Pseudovibrio sp. M1P-2-3]
MRILPVVATLLLVSACVQEDPSRETISLTGSTMGTTYTVKAIKGDAPITADELQFEVQEALKDVNDKMSNWVKTSEVERFNRSQSTEWTPISADFSAVLGEAFTIHEESTGRFDVTLAPLIDLWGFGPSEDQPSRPSDEKIAQALESVGMQTKLEYRNSPPALRKVNPETTVNLSAIAKGYGVDKVAATLEFNGIQEYLVEIGGDLITKGNNASNVPWVVGIEKPDTARQTVQEVIQLKDKALATSGDYRNYKEVDGRRLSHILDPVTGLPIEHKLASVTVIAESATRADGLATAIYALGDARGMHLALIKDLPIFMIIREGDSFVEKASPAFKALQNQHSTDEGTS